MKISLCIPMYNEASVIEQTALSLSDYMSKTFASEGYEILFSDDGCTDNSAEIIQNLALPSVKVVSYPDKKNRGKGAAVRNAVLASEGEVVMFTDADLAYGTEVIKKVSDAFDANPDASMIIGK